MNHEHKNSNHPMLVMEKLRHGGCYECYIYYLDMDGTHSTVFSGFYGAGRPDFYPAYNRVDSVHYSQNRHRHYTVCRSAESAGSRCVSPLLSRCPLEHDKAVADCDDNTCSNILWKHDHHFGSRQGHFFWANFRGQNSAIFQE